MTPHLRIMIVDDEPEIRRFLEKSLTQNGYTVQSVETGKDALRFCQADPPDLVVLDLGLPDMDGKEVVRSLRQWSRLPVIILSVRDREAEKVAVLELGADDYLTKPFGTNELLARIKVALRHASRRERPADDRYDFGDLSIDLARRDVSMNKNPLRLTPTEYHLLSLLARKAGQVVTQAELLREVWGKNAEDSDHYLRIYIQRLRQKIGDDPLDPRYIFTEPGIGYRLIADDS